MRERIDNLEDMDLSGLDSNVSSSVSDSIIPLFKALSIARENGLLEQEDDNFTRDIEFEKLLMDDKFNPENLTPENINTLNAYMDYLNKLMFTGDANKVRAALQSMKSKMSTKPKKPKWRDVKRLNKAFANIK